MSLKIYNTHKRTLETFVPQQPKHVKLYLCGPTVYGPAHLGHARSAITFDIITRYLRHLDHQVTYVRNITDIGHLMNDSDDGEDKIEQKAKHQHISPMEVAQRYSNDYHHDMAQLNILPPNIEPRATGHIPEQIALIEKIYNKGYAYTVAGSVYFDLETYQKKHPYDILSHKDTTTLRSGTRTLLKSTEKRNPNDFALWKKAQKNTIMQWNSPWGQGVPGWHIECTAMSQKYLGTHFDIHGGGLDLCFPHHACEIAQALATSETMPARYWIHNNLVTISGEKMSKSANNFITLQQCFQGNHQQLTQAYAPMTLRLFFLQAHYRSPINFSNTALQTAQKNYYKLINTLKTLEKLANHNFTAAQPTPLSQAIEADCHACHLAMQNDFNTAQTIAHLFALRKWINQLYTNQIDKKALPATSWTKLQQTYKTFLETILGLKEEHHMNPHTLINALITQYTKAKTRQDNQQIQEIRQVLHQEGILLQDNPTGITWSYKT